MAESETNQLGFALVCTLNFPKREVLKLLEEPCALAGVSFAGVIDPCLVFLNVFLPSRIDHAWSSRSESELKNRAFTQVVLDWNMQHPLEVRAPLS